MRLAMKWIRRVFLLLIATNVVVIIIRFFQTHSLAILNPQGEIASKERDLIVFAALLSLVIVIPVFAMTIRIVWKYRVGGSKKAKYTPEWDHHLGLESAWWAIPSVLILILSIVTWKSTYALDPYKKLDSPVAPIHIQVVALEWKWLFIYPEQNIASVNFMQFPEDTPINLEITADAPMNSFWIPKLGGQIYAMSGMSTKLHLLADQPGDFEGYSANISGEGFADMKFTARASSSRDFGKWVDTVLTSKDPLTIDTYNKLLVPSTEPAPIFYRKSQDHLYDTIVMKYMGGH